MSTNPTLLTPTTIRFTIHLDVPVGVALDFHTFWTQYLQAGQLGTLAAPIDATATQITLEGMAAVPTVNGPLAASGSSAVGTAIYCDGEVMLVTAVNGATLNVTRSPNPPLDFLLTPQNQAHQAGQPVYLLQYVSPFHWMAFKGLWPLAQEVSNVLGLNSHTYATAISGTISVSPASA